MSKIAEEEKKKKIYELVLLCTLLCQLVKADGRVKVVFTDASASWGEKDAAGRERTETANSR